MGRSAFPFHGIFSSPASETPLERQPAATLRVASQVGQVAVDIEEQDGYYVIKAPIAGVRLSDLDIEVEGCDVIIRGERRSSESSGSPLLQECFWGPFERRVSLPCQVDPKRVKATFNRECILRILVPKEREERVRIVRVGDLS